MDIEDFFDKKGMVPGFDRESRFTVNHDSFDDRFYQRIVEEIREFPQAAGQLKKITETADGAMADTFFSLFRPVASLKDKGQVSPSHQVNRAVMEVFHEMPEMDNLRDSTATDFTAAAFGATAMEPELEKLFDKLKKQQERASKLEGEMDQYSALSFEKEELEASAEEALAALGDQTPEERLQELQEQMVELEVSIREGADQLENEMQGKRSAIKDGLQKASQDAQEQAEGEAGAARAWGLDPGELTRLDPKERLKLARTVRDNPAFRQVAVMLGFVLRLAQAAQRRKVNDSPQEVFDVVRGDDFTRMVPAELALLAEEESELEFWRRYANKELYQYKMRGIEKKAQGGIVQLGDGSASMSGVWNVWEKAIGLAFLHICREQKRPFTYVNFGSANQYKKFVFDTTGKNFSCTTEYADGRGRVTTGELHGTDAVVEMASTFLASGTSFSTPLTVGMDQLKKEFDESGAASGDIVFVTDGLCQVSPDWEKSWTETKTEIGARVFGIAVGGSPYAEPMHRLCDGRTIAIKDLMEGKAAIDEIFRVV